MARRVRAHRAVVREAAAADHALARAGWRRPAGNDASPPSPVPRKTISMPLTWHKCICRQEREQSVTFRSYNSDKVPFLPLPKDAVVQDLLSAAPPETGVAIDELDDDILSWAPTQASSRRSSRKSPSAAADSLLPGGPERWGAPVISRQLSAQSPKRPSSEGPVTPGRTLGIPEGAVRPRRSRSGARPSINMGMASGGVDQFRRYIFQAVSKFSCCVATVG